MSSSSAPDDGRLVLAIDLGTSGPKVALVSEGGHLAAATFRPVRTRTQPPLIAEQSPEEIWQAVREAMADVLTQVPGAGSRVVGVIVSAQFASLVTVDAAGKPVTDLFLWLDKRGERYAEAFLEENIAALGPFLDQHGGVPLGPDGLSRMWFVREELPDAWARTDKFLEPADFVNLRLTGELSSNACTAFMFLLTDHRDPTAFDYSPELLEIAGIPREKLPPLGAVDGTVGALRGELARELGLPEGTPVLAAMNDTMAATFGAGAHRPGHGGLNVGTTMQVLAAAQDKHTDMEAQLVSMPSPLAGRWMTLAEIGLGAKTVEHFLTSIVYADDRLGRGAVDDPFARMDEAVAAEPPGSGGMLYLPFLSGAQAPTADPGMRGAFVHMGLDASRTRMLRAVLEGVAYHFRSALPPVEKFSGAPFDAGDLVFTGGAARSAAWAQILADVIGRPVAQLADPRHVNTRGAALAAFQRLGIVGPDDTERFRPIRQTFAPDASRRDRYDHQYAQFQAAFEALRPISNALGD